MPYDLLLVFRCTICDYLGVLAMFRYYITLSLSLYVYIYIYILASSVICNYFCNTWLLCSTTCDHLLLSLALVDLHVFRTTILNSINAEQTVHIYCCMKIDIPASLPYILLWHIRSLSDIAPIIHICLTMCIYLLESSASRYFPTSSVGCMQTLHLSFPTALKGIEVRCI